MPADRFDHLLHPLVRYERNELAAEKNALASWQAAGAEIADADELGDLASMFDPDCYCEEGSCVACKPPPADELRRRLLDVMQKNAAVRPLFERGLELGRLQVRLDPPANFDGGLGFQGLRHVARLNQCEGHLARLEGDPLSAAACYAKNVKAGRMLADCDGSIVLFLVSRAIHSTGQYALLRLAESGPVSPELRAILREARTLEIDAKLAAQVHRSELSQFNWPMLVSLAETPADGVLEKVAELFFSEPQEQEPDPDDPFAGIARGAAFARRARSILLEGHPDLWDGEETLRAVSLVTAGQIAELLDDEVSRQEIEVELRPWRERAKAYHELQPPELSPMGTFLALDENWKPASDRKLRKIRDKLRRQKNVLGIMVAEMTTGVGGRALLNRPEDDSEARWERVLG